jgi:hypothetical protein
MQNDDGRFSMKWLAAAGLLIAASGAAPLQAEEFPWCVEVDVFTKNCAFTSHDECVAVAKNVSSPATGEGRCIANPNYVAPPAPAKSVKAVPGKTSSTKPPAKQH